MNLICKWVTDDSGALVMKWTSRDDGVSVITRKPEVRKLVKLSRQVISNGESLAKRAVLAKGWK